MLTNEFKTSKGRKRKEVAFRTTSFKIKCLQHLLPDLGSNFILPLIIQTNNNPTVPPATGFRTYYHFFGHKRYV